MNEFDINLWAQFCVCTFIVAEIFLYFLATKNAFIAAALLFMAEI